jgi:pimeloyl-ACP methyl ester carboxylesterase
MKGKDVLLFLPIGGLGESQLEDITIAVSDIPGVVVKRLPGNDQYRDAHNLIWAFMDAYPDLHVFPFGHSLGAGTALNTANRAILDNRKVAGAGVADFVIYEPGPFESKTPNVLAYKSAMSFPFYTTDILGHTAKVIPGTGHNSVCHHPGVIADVVAFTEKLVQSYSATDI